MVCGAESYCAVTMKDACRLMVAGLFSYVIRFEDAAGMAGSHRMVR